MTDTVASTYHRLGWEYHYFDTYNHEVRDQLAQLGAEGWELVSTYYDPESRGGRYIFKRQVIR